jgi:hypothetical protein
MRMRVELIAVESTLRDQELKIRNTSQIRQENMRLVGLTAGARGVDIPR